MSQVEKLACDLSEQGRTRSAILGKNVEAMMGSGLSFLKSLETTLKVYAHDTPKKPRAGQVNIGRTYRRKTHE